MPGPAQLPVLAGRWQYDTRVVFAAGNNAQTFAGKDLRTGDEVVVKIFSHAAGGRGRARFLREARLHEELSDHDAILELLDRGPDNGIDYIVTRRLRPGALDGVVRNRSPLTAAATLDIGTRIADALAYMHGRDEVHGDISPGNILLDGEELAYLADFGFSKRVEAAPVATTGDGFGTEGFSLPREPGAWRTYEDDVYGLACVLWFCLTGESPPDSPAARRCAISSRALRAPLVRVLDWESRPIPTAEKFKDSLTKQWAKEAHDWRAVSAPPRRSRVPMIVAAGMATLAIAGLGGQALRPKPAAAAQTRIAGDEVTLNLDGRWKSKQAPLLRPFHLSAPVAATTAGGTAVVVGRAPSAGPSLIGDAARASMPPAARKPRPVTVGDRVALRYGPAPRFPGAVEVLALPLERKVLVVYCTAAAASASLPSVCAQAASDLGLRDGSVQQLAPTASVADRLRGAASRLSSERQQQRSLLAATSSPQKLSAAAEDLAGANRGFAKRIGALPTTAQDAKGVGAAVHAARKTAAAYAGLAQASDNSAWITAQALVDQQEQQLEAAIRRLAALRVYES